MRWVKKRAAVLRCSTNRWRRSHSSSARSTPKGQNMNSNGQTATLADLVAKNLQLNEFADRVAHRLKRTLVNLSAYGEEIKSLLEAQEAEAALELVDEQIA